jgi:hypothetical protein
MLQRVFLFRGRHDFYQHEQPTIQLESPLLRDMRANGDQRCRVVGAAQQKKKFGTNWSRIGASPPVRQVHGFPKKYHPNYVI